jgi:hypothetical protein
MEIYKYRAKYWRSLAVYSRVFTANLKRKIKEVKAIRTGKMLRTTKGKYGKINVIQVDSTNYFPYVDEGTSRIKPRQITKKALNATQTQKAMDEVVKAYVEWQIAEELLK